MMDLERAEARSKNPPGTALGRKVVIGKVADPASIQLLNCPRQKSGGASCVLQMVQQGMATEVFNCTWGT